MVSIIIPTLNERANVRAIVAAIKTVLTGQSYEIIFVDDSDDETPALLREMARRERRVRFIHRYGQRGLGTAVALGFRMAQGEILGVMDADLQHPPELLPIMLERLESGSADLVIPSRFLPGAANGIGGGRRLVSQAARWMARLFLSRSRLSSDPLGGFFMVKKSCLAEVALNPIGWKILLEILVKGRFRRIVELPYVFQSRRADRSKMSGREVWNCLRHILRLVRDSPVERRVWQSRADMAAGLGMGLLLFAILRQGPSVPAVWKEIFPTAIALLPGNYRRMGPAPRLKRLLKLVLIDLSAIVIGFSFLIGLQAKAQLNSDWAQFLTIGMALAWNAAAEHWLSSKRSAADSPEPGQESPA